MDGPPEEFNELCMKFIAMLKLEHGFDVVMCIAAKNEDVMGTSYFATVTSEEALGKNLNQMLAQHIKAMNLPVAKLN